MPHSMLYQANAPLALYSGYMFPYENFREFMRIVQPDESHTSLTSSCITVYDSWSTANPTRRRKTLFVTRKQQMSISPSILFIWSSFRTTDQGDGKTTPSHVFFATRWVPYNPETDSSRLSHPETHPDLWNATNTDEEKLSGLLEEAEQDGINLDRDLFVFSCIENTHPLQDPMAPVWFHSSIWYSALADVSVKEYVSLMDRNY